MRFEITLGGFVQFKVPQNIDLEDKIVGPLTLIQFLYVISGGIIIYLLFLTLGSTFLFWVLAVPIAAIALALAFLKIQEQPLSHFIKAGLMYLGRPKVRIWQRHGINISAIKAAPLKKEGSTALPKKRIEKSELEKIAQMLDTGMVKREV